MVINPTYPPESYEQKEIFRWSRLNISKNKHLKYLNASLSGVRLTVGQRTEMKRQGMVKGFPDIFLPYNNDSYSGLFIELKRVKGGVMSKEQKDWLEYLKSQKYLALRCNGHADSIELIKKYLNGKL